MLARGVAAVADLVAKNGKSAGLLLAVVSTLVMAALRSLLDPWIGVEWPLLPFMLSVLVTAWYAGRNAALVALLLGLAAGSWLFISPRLAFGMPDGIATLRIILYASFSLMIALIVPRLAQAMQVMREGYEEFRAIFDTSAAGMAQVDATAGRIVRANRTLCRLLGYTEEELLRVPSKELTYPEDRARAMESVDALLGGEIGEFTIEKRYVHKDGHPVWVQVTVNGVRDASGRVFRTSALIQGIEERRRIADEREAFLVSERRARGDAERANRSKDEFVATLSHELRTPLNAIMGWVQLLRRGNLDAATVAKGLAVIERNTRVQTQLISDLLDVNRIVSGKVRLDIGPVRLQAVIGAAVETMLPGAQAKGIALETDLDPAVAPTTGDAARLQQVVLNLLTNSIKFTPAGGRVSVHLDQQGPDARIRVIDDGEGIPPSFLPMIFERYRQADQGSMRQFGGLGLGLSIVRHLAELHGGQVEAASDGPGRGATFTVTLPLRDPADGAQRRAPGTRLDLTRTRVLVVDDDADARDILGLMLQGYGAVVTSAASADEALAALRLAAVDVLICDISMPHKDGYALIEAIRDLPPERGGCIPAIAVTAYARAEDRARALRSGFQEHLPKPVDPTQLTAAIAALRNAPVASVAQPIG